MNNRSIKEFYFIRHGETEWNVKEKLQSCESNIELNNLGKKQADKTGHYLNNFRLNSGTFDLIVSSGMKRTNETAKLIADALGYNKDIVVMEEFEEICNGKLDGYTHNELIKKFKIYAEREELVKNELDPIKQKEIYYENNKIFNEEYGQELIKDIKKRIKKGLEKLSSLQEKKIIIVLHGGIIQYLLRILTGINDSIKSAGNCSITYIKLYQIIKNNKIKKKYKIIQLPNTEHLK